MFRTIIILSVSVLFFSGCTGLKKTARNDTAGENIGTGRVIMQTGTRNLTNSGFFIQKGRITTSGEAGRINLLFTMKYVKPDNYLISLRSITGIEALRVYISGDTVLINDRLNQEVLYGNPYEFERITGIHPDLLKVSLGDLVTDNIRITNNDDCSGNELNVESYYMGLLINSIIDCRLEKVKAIILSSGVPGERISIDYLRHRYDYFRIPRRIEINDSGRNVKITLKIEKYISPWIGDIEFIPGSGYKKRSLI